MIKYEYMLLARLAQFVADENKLLTTYAALSDSAELVQIELVSKDHFGIDGAVLCWNSDNAKRPVAQLQFLPFQDVAGNCRVPYVGSFERILTAVQNTDIVDTDERVAQTHSRVKKCCRRMIKMLRATSDIVKTAEKHSVLFDASSRTSRVAIRSTYSVAKGQASCDAEFAVSAVSEHPCEYQSFRLCDGGGPESDALYAGLISEESYTVADFITPFKGEYIPCFVGDPANADTFFEAWIEDRLNP